jgi:3'(2'), 5'-bisphosphate nucleotidase
MFDKVLEIVKQAGKEILKVYNSADFEVEKKGDGSPLTLADRVSNQVLTEGLKTLSNYPILSEESKRIPYGERKNWERFWLIDPLDGTKEFIKRNGEFTVNVALVERGKPVWGAVYAPAINLLYYTEGDKAFKESPKGVKEIKVKKGVKDKLKVVVSRSHLNEETKNFLKLLEEVKEIEAVSIGSSLKICLVAEGEAHLYPRLGPTMEWDTAAAHAVLKAAGGEIYRYPEGGISLPIDFSSLEVLTYNKPDLLNPYFLATGLNGLP